MTDGKPDILWTNTTTGERGIWLMDGPTHTGWAGLGVMPVAWRIAGVADYSGDGQLDIMWENTLTGERGYWLMNGATHTAWVDLGIMPLGWGILN